MKRIIREEVCARVADRWKSQYFRASTGLGRVPGYPGKPVWQHLSGTRSSEELYEGLLALGPSPSREEIDDLIGGTSWTRIECDECREDVEAAVMAGQPEDYDSATATLCEPCLRQATELLADEDEDTEEGPRSWPDYENLR